MSYDDYVTHIIQKYRLAVSIAVIRSKPEDITLERYIQQLRSKIIDKIMDTDNFTISICDDDFDIDDTNIISLNIDGKDDENDKLNKENHQKIKINHADITRNTPHLVDVASNIDINSSKVWSQDSNDKQVPIYHRNEENDVEMIDTQDLNNSTTILQNFEVDNADLNKNSTQRRSFEDVMEILQSIDGNLTIIEKGISQNKSIDRIKSQTAETSHISQHHAYNDATLCESIDILSNVEDHNLRQDFKFNYNHISNCNYEQKDSNKQIDMNSKSILSNQKPKINTQSYQCKTDEAELNTIISKVQSKSREKQDEKKEKNKFKVTESKPQSNMREYRHTKEFKNIYQNVAGIFDNKRNNKINEDKIISDSTELTFSEKFKEMSQKSQDYCITQTIPDNLTCKTHYSESQINDIIIIQDEYIHGTKKDSNKQKNDEKNESDSVITKGAHINNDILSQPMQKTISVLPKNSTQNVDTCMTIYNNNNKDNEKYTKRNTKHDKVDKFDIEIFSQESQLTNISSDTAKYSQNFDNINHTNKETEGKFQIYGNNEVLTNKKQAKSIVRYVDKDLFSQESNLTNFSTISTNDNQNITENNSELLQDAQNLDEYFSRFGTGKTRNEKTSNENFTNILGDERCTEFDKHSENIQVFKVKTTEYNATEKLIQDNKRCTDFDKNLDNTLELFPSIESGKKVAKSTNFDGSQNMEVEEEWTDSQIEHIPFKVIEELNKVKMYLKKRNEKKMNAEGSSSDTGYKSDSQFKTSFMSQSASRVSWLDQSGHSIFNYLTDCVLVNTTQDITNEISVVLGLLIDKLHDEERYPSFLEELLETVKLMIKVVYEEISGENVLIDKDETIQRILLLNKSTHIQRYTIEKITHILENLHTELTSKDKIYEIENIDRMENVCYIFYILEIILQRHKKPSQNLSKSTQNSQEDRVLKKSSILDIWRKKWNPNYKETQNEGSSEKICVINTCSAILNKLIVDCMDGYSLVSYYALKCFNVMQT